MITRNLKKKKNNAMLIILWNRPYHGLLLPVQLYINYMNYIKSNIYMIIYGKNILSIFLNSSSLASKKNFFWAPCENNVGNNTIFFFIPFMDLLWLYAKYLFIDNIFHFAL